MRVPRYVFQDAALPEPWRQHPKAARTEVRLIPTVIARQCADKRQVSEILAHEAEYVSELAADIKENGLRDPLIFHVDGAGRFCLRNGHHRMLAAEIIGMNWLPFVVGGLKNATPETHLVLVPNESFDWWLRKTSRSPRFSSWL